MADLSAITAPRQAELCQSSPTIRRSLITTYLDAPRRIILTPKINDDLSAMEMLVVLTEGAWGSSRRKPQLEPLRRDVNSRVA